MIMSSIATSVLKATVGLLVNKGRDAAAEKLEDGDVTDEKVRNLIVRDLTDIKKKLDGLSRKDLLASISLFKEGIEYLREVFAKARSRSEYGSVTTQAACAEAFSLAQGMRNLELTDLDESAMTTLSNAKKRFEDSRIKATEAVGNEALETADRILAMQYRVMATILETIDNPADALAPCRVCTEELNSMPAVQNSFGVQLKKGLGAVRGLFGKDERRKIISNVCQLNRVIYDVTLTIGKDAHFWIWPPIDIGEDKVDPLRDERVTEYLRKHGMEQYCVTPWSFGQEGEEEHKLKWAKGIATNSSGQYIVGDHGNRNVKVFDSKGTFIKHFNKGVGLDVATDIDDNIYVLVALKNTNGAVYEFDNTADLKHTFPVMVNRDWIAFYKLTVTENGTVLILKENTNRRWYHCREVAWHAKDGRSLGLFYQGIWKFASDITAANDGRVMIVNSSCVHTFTERGDHLNTFELKGWHYRPRIAFHRASEHVVIAFVEERTKLLYVEMYNKDGKFERSIQIHDKRVNYVRGVTVTTEGCIAIVGREEILVI